MTRRGCLEPLLEAGAAADVLALGAAEGLGGELKADYASKLLLERGEGVALRLLIFDCLIDANLFIHALDLKHVSFQRASQRYFSPGHKNVDCKGKIN